MIEQKEKISDATASQFFWHLHDFNAVPIITWGFNGEVITANDAFLDLIGYSRSELDNKAINWSALTPSEYHFLDKQCMKQLDNSLIADVYEKEYIKKDGSRVRVKLYNATAQGVDRQAVAIIIAI